MSKKVVQFKNDKEVFAALLKGEHIIDDYDYVYYLDKDGCLMVRNVDDAASTAWESELCINYPAKVYEQTVTITKKEYDSLIAKTQKSKVKK